MASRSLVLLFACYFMCCCWLPSSPLKWEHSRGALQGSTLGLSPCTAAQPGFYTDFTYCCSFKCLPPVPCWPYIHPCVPAPSLTSPVNFRRLIYTSTFMPTRCLYLSSSNMIFLSSSQACPTHPSSSGVAPPSFWMLRVLTPLRFSC